MALQLLPGCPPPRPNPQTSPQRGRPRMHGRRQRGLTMIELLVSITIGLLIVGAVLYVYLGSRGAYRSSRSTSRIQEAGHYGLDAMLNDVRQAGYIGCGSRMALDGSAAPITIYQIANPPLPLGNFAPGQVLYGETARDLLTSPPTNLMNVPPVVGTSYYGDVLVLNISTGAALAMVKPPDTTIPAIFVANNCGDQIHEDAYLMVANCSVATVLRVANKPATGPAACPTGGATPGVVPGGVRVDHYANDTTGKQVNGNASNNNSTALTRSMKPMSISEMPSAMMFDQIIYYVGQLAPRPPALYRYSTANQASEEVIDHIEAMRLVYGVPGPGGVVAFQTAGQVSAGGAAAWANVASVCISLIVAGDDKGVAATPQTVTFGCPGTPAAVGYTEPDTFLRQVFTTTAALRDKLP